MKNHFLLMTLILLVSLGNVAWAQEAEEGEDYQLDPGGSGEGDYQLRGPEELTSPDEFLTGPTTEEEDLEEEETATPEEEEEPGEEESPVSLDLDLEEDDETELPPVHPVEPVEEERTRWLLVPPYYQGIRGDSGVRLFFPFFYQRWTAAGQRQVAVLPWAYWSRGPTEAHSAEVAFPLFWRLRSPERRTLVIGNVYTSRGETSSHHGVAPLIFWGNTENWSYQVGFPLYFRMRHQDGHGFTLATLWFDHRMEGDRYRRGIFPLVWIGERQGRGYALGLPLVYHFWRRAEGSSTTVVPPVYWEQFADGYGFGLAPVLFYRQRANRSRLTVFPLFHYSTREDNRLFISSVAWYRRNAESRMGGVLLYHWSRREHSTFDGFIPFYLRGTNTRLGSSWQYIFPTIFTSRSPVSRRSVFFPIVWDFENRHRSRTTAVLPLYLHHRNFATNSATTWVLPTIQYSTRPDGWAFNLHPILYLSTGENRSHSVVFPVWWRFQRPDLTTTIGFPLWFDFQRPNRRFSVFFPFVWRQRTEHRTWTAVLNAVYTSGERSGIPFWSFNFFPFFRIARPSPQDIEWQILLGLAGYGRRGDRRWVDVFWVPIELRNRQDQAEISATSTTIESNF